MNNIQREQAQSLFPLFLSSLTGSFVIPIELSERRDLRHQKADGSTALTMTIRCAHRDNAVRLRDKQIQLVLKFFIFT